MKMIGQHIKQAITQQPLKYGIVLVAVIGLVILGVFRQVQSKDDTKSELTTLTATSTQQDTTSKKDKSTTVAQSNRHESNQGVSEKVAQTPTKYYVEIKGEVAKPNVYQVPEDARINDLVKLAGGLTREADRRQINLAQSVQDGLSIYVPKKGEELVTQEQSSVPATSTDAGSTGTSEAGVKNKVNLNQSDSTQLQQVSGIGPKKAADIVAYREKEGPFTSVDELTKVSGIGEKTLENIRDQLCI